MATKETRTPSRSLLWIVVLLLVVASASLWGAAELSEIPSGLTGLAVVALAAVAGVISTQGVFRRFFGFILVVIAGGATILLEATLLAPPVTGSILRVLGLVTLLGAGIFTLWWGHRMPYLGAKYTSTRHKSRAIDPDRQLWDTLDSGNDPTIEPNKPDELKA